MEKHPIPTSVEEITTEWLTGALTRSGVLSGNAVRSVTSSIIGDDVGYMGILARLSIEYDRPDDSLPSTMVAKIPTQVAKNKMIMEAFWNFERENRLYEEILHQLPLRTPRCYYSDFDQGKGQQWMDSAYRRYGILPASLVGLYFIYVGIKNVRLKRRYILLLEDYGGFEQIDQRDGCCLDDAKMVMKPLGLAHATFWESAQLKQKYWLKDHSNFSNMMSFLSGRALPVFKKIYPEKLNQTVLEVFDWLKNNHKKLDEFSKTRPHTLIHTDYRLDNIFFNRDKNEVAVIDWQASCPGMGLFDPCFFFLNNGSRPFTAGEAEAMITIYHQGLVEGGVSNYSIDDCMADYPFGFLLALRYVMIIAGGIEVKKDPNAKLLIGLWLDRMKPLIEALDLPAL